MQRVTLNGPMGATLVAIVVIAVFVIVQLPALAVSLLSIGGGEDESTAALERMVVAHDESMALYQTRFNGRSLFFKPPPKPKPQVRRADPPPKPVEPDTPPPPPKQTAPPKYMGPSLLAIFDDEAWFQPESTGQPPLRVAMGETRAGVEVIAVDLPMSVKVKHSGGEYDLELFERPPAGIWEAQNDTRAVPGLVELEPGPEAKPDAEPEVIADDADPVVVKEAKRAELAAETEIDGEDDEVVDDGAEPIEDEVVVDEGEEPLDDEPLDDEIDPEEGELEDDEGEYVDDEGEFEDGEGEFEDGEGEFEDGEGEFEDEGGEPVDDELGDDPNE